MKNAIWETWNVYSFTSCDCYHCDFSYNTWSEFWLIQGRIYQTRWLLCYIDRDFLPLSLFDRDFYLSRVSDCFYEQFHSWVKIQNYFNSKIFQGFSYVIKGFPHIILIISNYICTQNHQSGFLSKRCSFYLDSW